MDRIRRLRPHREDLHIMPALSASAFQILLALGDSELHGYAIMNEVRQATDGATRLGPGTLYYTLQRLMNSRFIEEAVERPAPDVDDERRIYYRVTAAGRRAAEKEAARLAQLVDLARARSFLKDRG